MCLTSGVRTVQTHRQNGNSEQRRSYASQINTIANDQQMHAIKIFTTISLYKILYIHKVYMYKRVKYKAQKYSKRKKPTIKIPHM